MSVPRIDGSGCGYWLTPRAIYAEHPGMTDESHLAGQAITASWPTPKGSPSGPDFARTNREGSGGDDLATRVARGGATRQTWPTPDTGLTPNGHGRRGGKAGNGCQSGASLEAIARGQSTPRTWGTPTSRDHKDTGTMENVPENALLGRQTVNDSTTPGSLSPLWVEWLQGFPPEWTDCAASVTPSVLRRWLRRGRCWLAGLGY